MLSGEELHARGVEAINAGRVGRARSLLEAARRREPSPDLGARIVASLAYVLADLGESAEAVALCGDALASERITPATRGVLTAQRGLLLMRAGDLAAARADLNAAARSLPPGSVDHGKVLLNRGGTHLQGHDPVRAARDFEQAASVLGAQGLRTEAAKATHNAGYARFLEGRPVEALALMDAAAPVLVPLSEVSRAIGQQDRAEVLLACGLTAQGLTALEEAAAAYGSRRLRRRQAECELAAARHLGVTDPARAASVAARAARRFERLDLPAWSARSRALALAAQARSATDPTALLPHADAVLAVLEVDGPSWPAHTLRLHLALALHQRGRRADAAAYLPPRAPRDAPIANQLLAAVVRARIAVAEGRRDVALRHVRAGSDVMATWQSSFGSLDLQTGVVGHGVELAALGLHLAVTSPRPDLLLELSERARTVASRIQPMRTSQDPDLAADLAALRSLAVAVGDGEAATELRRRVRERAWGRSGSGEVRGHCSLTELQAGLGPSTALVAYVVTREVVVALVVTDSGVRRHVLGPRSALDQLLRGLHADLDAAAESLPTGLGELVRGQLVERLGRLGEFLVAPLLDRVGDRGVVLTASGVLAGLPWTLLPGFGGRCVTVAQSATSWLVRGETPLRTGSVGFVAGPRVERAEAEVAGAAAVWPAPRCLTGPDATAVAVSELAATVDVLHVAAHGRHSAENPLFSGVELVDGVWHAYDVDQLESVPDVVLLSACEVGRSSVRWGEELIGMTAAWLHAGALCVIASAAAVADEVAHDVLVEVHRHLTAGATPAAALAAAVPAATAGRPPAPFVCFG